MRVIGIIAEYNPFHNGHEYLIRKARESVGDNRAVVMSIMSGPFTQRGLPAIAPSHVRAKQALLCGSDVVLELPFEFACAPANEFAYGAVRSLIATGVVTDIAFGIDSGRPEIIEFLSSPELYSSDEYQSVLKVSLADGMSFPAASAKAVISSVTSCPFDLDELADCMHSPNTILAIEYLKAIKSLGAKFKVHMIQRTGQGYSEDDITASGIPSATSIRKALYSCGGSVASAGNVLSGSVPDASAAVFLSALSKKSFQITDLDKYALRAVTSIPGDLSAVRFCGDGLSGYLTNILSDLRGSDVSFDELSAKLNTKHFTMPRIYRALTMMMLGIRADDTGKDPEFIRVLGFNHEGRYCLKIMGKCAKLPIIHNHSDFLEHPSLAKTKKINEDAANLADTFMGIAPFSLWNEPPVVVK